MCFPLPARARSSRTPQRARVIDLAVSVGTATCSQGRTRPGSSGAAPGPEALTLDAGPRPGVKDQPRPERHAVSCAARVRASALSAVRRKARRVGRRHEDASAGAAFASSPGIAKRSSALRRRAEVDVTGSGVQESCDGSGTGQRQVHVRVPMDPVAARHPPERLGRMEAGRARCTSLGRRSERCPCRRHSPLQALPNVSERCDMSLDSAPSRLEGAHVGHRSRERSGLRGGRCGHVMDDRGRGRHLPGTAGPGVSPSVAIGGTRVGPAIGKPGARACPNVPKRRARSVFDCPRGGGSGASVSAGQTGDHRSDLA